MLKLTQTADGSHSLYHELLDEHYHSQHGALRESSHVFIDQGLRFILRQGTKHIRIFEMGLGTGLNVLLTVLASRKYDNLVVSYTAVEASPVSKEFLEQLNYPDLTGEPDAAELFKKIHQLPFGQEGMLTPVFTLKKILGKIEEVALEEKFDLVYYDAFGPRVQPELWQMPVLSRIAALIGNGGVLVTYCAQGAFRRNLRDLGFSIEALPGPPGKREMIRAIKD